MANNSRIDKSTTEEISEKKKNQLNGLRHKSHEKNGKSGQNFRCKLFVEVLQ